jgi:phage terminase large subunit
LDTVDNSIIESEWFDACIDAHIKLGFNAEGQDKLAFDPADTGDAKALAYSRGCVVLGVTETKTGLINEATDWAIGYANKIKPDVFIWDVGGSGGGLVRQVQDGLKGKRIKIVQFNGAMIPHDPNGEYDAIEGEGFVDMEGRRTNTNMFINQRAQCYWKLRDRIFKTYLAVVKGKYFPKDELISFSSDIKLLQALRAEICRIPRKLGVPSGRIQILSKPEMKKLGISSPNMADAVMMLQRDVDIYSDDDYEESVTPLNPDSWA